jgi:hypothetical protein
MSDRREKRFPGRGKRERVKEVFIMGGTEGWRMTE